jgi:hypothetical protein
MKHKTFVTFIGQNFLGKMDVQQISEHIAKCTDYSPATIFFHKLMHTEKSKEIMEKLTADSHVHIKSKFSLETEFLYCLYTIKNFLLSTDNSKIMELFENDLRQKFNIEPNSVQHIKTLLMKTFNSISGNRKDKQIFLCVMQTKWMKFNTGDITHHHPHEKFMVYF